VEIALVVEGEPLLDDRARVLGEAEADVRVDDVGALRRGGRWRDQRRERGDDRDQTASHPGAQASGLFACAFWRRRRKLTGRRLGFLRGVEELARLEVESVRDHRRREDLDEGVVGLDRVVVDAAGDLDLVLGLRELRLELKVLGGAGSGYCSATTISLPIAVVSVSSAAA
jgi:hypothetical protein